MRQMGRCNIEGTCLLSAHFPVRKSVAAGAAACRFSKDSGKGGYR